jgi:hypothetical protein
MKLSPEAEELVNYQSELDCELLKSMDNTVAFRPQIDGEFDVERSLGCARSRIVADRQIPGGDWVCVVDVLRALKRATKYSGFRVRVPCPPPVTPAVRNEIAEIAIAMVCRDIKKLQSFNARSKSKKKGFAKTNSDVTLTGKLSVFCMEQDVR